MFYKEKIQSILDALAQEDTYGFLKNVENWSNHRPLLWLALSFTHSNPHGPVIEFGSGDGSTPYLREYCKSHGRFFESWESDKEWAEKTGSSYTSSWDVPSLYRQCSVFFCDHAPGEHRHKAIELFVNKAEIIVVHDTEEGGAGNYMFDRIWPLFKKRINYNRLGGGAGATLLSNVIDLDGLDGCNIAGFELEKKLA